MGILGKIENWRAFLYGKMRIRWLKMVFRKKRVFVPITIILVFLTVWLLGTGFILVEPQTLKVVKQNPITHRSGLTTYGAVPYLNQSHKTILVWKGPIKPEFEIRKKDLNFTFPLIGKKVNIPLKWVWIRGIQTGRVKEIIDLNKDLKFQRKIVVYSMDRETGNPEDKYTILAAVISGTLKVNNWELFIKGYNPDNFNLLLKKEGLDFKKFNTIDYWETQLGDMVFRGVLDEIGYLPMDGVFRYQYVRSLIESNPRLTTPELIENYIKEEEPVIWVVGPVVFEGIKKYPEFLTMGDSEIAKVLYEIGVSINSIEKIDSIIKDIQEERDKFYRLTKTKLIKEAETLLEDFRQELKENNQDLASLKSKGIFDLKVKSFLNERGEVSEDGRLAFSILVKFEWTKAALLDYRTGMEVMLVRATSELKNLPEFGDELNTYFWQLIIKAALANPDADETYIGKYVICPFLRNPVLWERATKTIPEGDIWRAEDLSIELKEVPLFVNGQVDPDFYFFYHFKKEKYEESNSSSENQTENR
jgi:hypothetical protein